MASILIGSRALCEFHTGFAFSDIDLILDRQTLAGLSGFEIKPSPTPRHYMGVGPVILDITEFHLPSHYLLLDHISHEIQLYDMTVLVPTLSALRAIKQGAVRGGIKPVKTKRDFALFDTLQGWEENSKTLELAEAIYIEAKNSYVP